MLTYVIISDRDRTPKGVTEQTLKTARQISEPFEIIVVEGSDHKWQGCKTIKQRKPFNYNQCLNEGIKHAKGEWIALCNNDLEFTPNWFAPIKAANVLSASPTEQPCKDAVGYEIRNHVKGWCIVIKRELLEIIGQLPTVYSFWYADNAYADLLMKHNVQHHLIGSSIVKHLESATLMTLPEDERQAMTREITKRYEGDRMAQLAQYKWRKRAGLKAKTVVFYNPFEVVDLDNMTQSQAVRIVMSPEYCHLLEPIGEPLPEDKPEANLGAVEVMMYCINLARATERRAKVEQEFKREGLSVEFIEAIDAKQIESKGQPAGFKACLLSHAKAIEEAVGEYALIFEDDVELIEGFAAKLREAVAELPTNFLFAQLNGLPVRTLTAHGCWQRVWESYGAFAYLVNLRYRDEVLRQLYAHQETTNLDEVYVKMQPHYLCYQLIAKPIAYHAKGYSFRQEDFPRQGVYKTVEKP